MTTVLYFSTIVLNAINVWDALTYIWLNALEKRSDVKMRSEGILADLKFSIILCFVFSLLTCLLETKMTVFASIERMAHLCSMIAISWLLILVGCLVTMAGIFIFKKSYKPSTMTEMRKLISYAVPSASVGIFLSWILS